MKPNKTKSKRVKKKQKIGYLTVSTSAAPFHPIFLGIHEALKGKTFLDITLKNEERDFGKLIIIKFKSNSKE